MNRPRPQQPASGAPPTTHPRDIDAADDLQLAGRLRCGA